MMVDDRAKLLMHRMIARRLDAAAVDAARAWNADHDDGRDCRQEWRDLLDLPVDLIRRRLTERAEEMTRLRPSSPFPATCEFTDEALRRRFWRLAKKPQYLALAQNYDDLMDVDDDIASLHEPMRWITQAPRSCAGMALPKPRSSRNPHTPRAVSNDPPPRSFCSGRPDDRQPGCQAGPTHS